MAPPRAAAAAVAAFALGLGQCTRLAAAQPRGGGGPQKLEPPKWLSDDGKDIFNDIESDEKVYGEASCELREKLLKHMAGKGEKDAADHRARVLLGIGLCDFKKANFKNSMKRIESAVSEMNVPNEEMLMQNPQSASIVLMKQAAAFMTKKEVTQAGTALRRCREVLDRSLKKVLKMVHKQMQQGGQQVPPLENMLEEVPGYGKTGQILPLLLPQVPMLKQDFAWAELVDNSLDTLDRQIASLDASQKPKRDRLDVSKGKSKGGTLLYAKALTAEAVVPAERMAAAQELVAAGIAKALKAEAASVEKGVTLLKRARDGSGCKEDKGFSETCAALKKVPDIASNGFGEARLLVVKGGKAQQLETCSTNANVGILVAAKDGASLKVAGEETALQEGEPVVVDFCREASLSAPATTPILFAQAWHPEFAAVERTTELRARAKAFGHSEDDVKAVTKIVNDYAKKNWEKTAAAWRKDSSGLQALKSAMEAEAAEKDKASKDAAEAARLAEEAGDEERQKALEELEKKRAEKRKREEEAEAKRLARKKQLEQERANRDPWLSDPEVVEAEKNVEDLKEQRRDANAKLEFEISTQLTKDISAAERKLKKVTKAARKAWKKAQGGTAAGEKGEKAAAKESSSGGSEAETLQKELAEVREKKAAASKAEDFKEAKKLKGLEKELEAKIKKLEL